MRSLLKASLFLAGTGFAITGLLYPEPKNQVYFIPFPWIFICILAPLSFHIYLTNQKRRNIVNIALLLFTLICVPSWAFHAPSYQHILRVYPTFLFTSIISFLFLSMLSEDDFRRYFFNFSTAMAVALLLFRISINDFSREAGFLGLGPLTFARYLGLGLLSGITLPFPKAKGFVICLKYLGILLALAVTDSRAPLLFLVLVCALFLLRRHSLLSPKLGLLGLLFLPTLYFARERFLSLIHDITSISAIGNFSSSFVNAQIGSESISGVYARAYAFIESLPLIRDYGLEGIGAGNWVHLTGLYSLEYPHNLLIELWVEYGLLGLILFILAVRLCFVSLKSNRPLAYPLCFLILMSLTSGSVRDARFIFIFLLLDLFYAIRWRSEAGFPAHLRAEIQATTDSGV